MRTRRGTATGGNRDTDDISDICSTGFEGNGPRTNDGRGLRARRPMAVHAPQRSRGGGAGCRGGKRPRRGGLGRVPGGPQHDVLPGVPPSGRRTGTRLVRGVLRAVGGVVLRSGVSLGVRTHRLLPGRDRRARPAGRTRTRTYAARGPRAVRRRPHRRVETGNERVEPHRLPDPTDRSLPPCRRDPRRSHRRGRRRGARGRPAASSRGPRVRLGASGRVRRRRRPPRRHASVDGRDERGVVGSRR